MSGAIPLAANPSVLRKVSRLEQRRTAGARLIARTALLVSICAGGITVAAASAVSAAKPRSAVPPSPAKPTVPEARRRASWLSNATPEARERLSEERKRLSAATATGTDPTAIIGFYQLAYGHSAYTHGLSTNAGSAVARPPLTPNWVFQFSMPYVWADLNRPQASFRANGTSDMELRTGGRLVDLGH